MPLMAYICSDPLAMVVIINFKLKLLVISQYSIITYLKINVSLYATLICTYFVFLIFS